MLDKLGLTYPQYLVLLVLELQQLKARLDQLINLLNR